MRWNLTEEELCASFILAIYSKYILVERDRNEGGEERLFEIGKVFRSKFKVAGKRTRMEQARSGLSQKLVDLLTEGLICCPVEITAERVRPGGRRRRRRDNGSLPGLERENVRYHRRLTYRVITAFIFTHHRY